MSNEETTDDWQIVAAERSINFMVEHDYDRPGSTAMGTSVEHLIGMLPKMREPMSRAKRGRWLGWMQGVMAALMKPGVVSLDTFKQINKTASDEWEANQR